MTFIDPRIDFAFKKIFGSEDAKDILISFLESLMGLEEDRRIREVTILNPFLAPRIKGMKDSVLDVRCTDHRGISYIVEMQVRKTQAFLKRIQYNAAKVYVNQIASAEAYPKLNQVIAITITDFTLFDEISHYLSHHQTVEKSTGKSFLREIVFYFIELSKFTKNLDDLVDVLDKWIFFIKTAGTLEDIPDRLRDEPFHHAFEKARVANMDRQELEYYDKAGMAITDARGAIELALEEGERKGWQKGLQEGRQEGRREEAGAVLRRLLQRRFGSLPAWADERITTAGLDSLEKWTDRMLDTHALGELFAE